MRKTGLAEILIHENIDKLAQESLKTLHMPKTVNSSELVIPVSLHESVFPESLVLYNQSMALTHYVTSSDQKSGSRSATLPRKAVHNTDLGKQVNKQGRTMEIPSGEPKAKGWRCLLESVSVPDTLNKATGIDTSCGPYQGGSERTLLELSKGNPFPHPKAWFVSLEGKPAAQVWHSFVDLRKCHLLITDSNETSMDLGVNLNKQLQKQSQSYPKRNTAQTQPVYSENADLSGCESITIPASTPENTHQSSSRTMSNLPEEKCDNEMLYEGSECAPSRRVQRLRRTREKPKSTWHLREERPLMKLN